MHHKSTPIFGFQQKPIAGITKESDVVEFFGIRKNKTVKWLNKGVVHQFSELPPKYYALLSNAFYRDQQAVKYFRQFSISEKRKVELFTYYCYGDLDHRPDIIDGKLSTCENFRDTVDCPSLRFDSKNIRIGDEILLPRELTIIDMVARDCKDWVIAEALNISIVTLGFHKRTLFKKTNTQTRTGLLRRAMHENIV